MTAGAADAGDDEDDAISLSSKASANPQSSLSDEWQQVHLGYVEQYGPWPGKMQDGWTVPLVMQLAPQHSQI